MRKLWMSISMSHGSNSKPKIADNFRNYRQIWGRATKTKITDTEYPYYWRRSHCRIRNLVHGIKKKMMATLNDMLVEQAQTNLDTSPSQATQQPCGTTLQIKICQDRSKAYYLGWLWIGPRLICCVFGVLVQGLLACLKPQARCRRILNFRIPLIMALT